MRMHARRLPLLAALLTSPLLAFSQEPPGDAARADAAPPPPANLFDPRLARLRVASASWMSRPGPSRQVVDQVCLVPDLPTYLEAVATWDRGHYFPVLFDNTEQALRFLRAFRPGRVVRSPARAESGERSDEESWERAVGAVGRSWDEAGTEGEPPAGDRPPRFGVEPGPPGVVLSSPASPSLAGAVALAAGRFQPLVRWDPGATGRDVPKMEDAARLALDLERTVSAVTPDHGGLADDCDFVTLAGDWPDRYVIPPSAAKRENVLSKQGESAFDDLAGRDLRTGRRWAYLGRILGDEAESAYQAMCSLFLQPESALMFNSYSETEDMWRDYEMRQAKESLGRVLPVVHRAGGEESGLAGWRRAFDPINRHGLVMVNSSGGPTRFRVLGGQEGATNDVPLSVPAAVLMIHSFSAARPSDTSTIAGRWRANGAFLYFGSMNEPYLQAFRQPNLVASLLAEGLPVSAAVRRLAEEGPFGTNWRLIVLGDPLYALDPKAAKRPRLRSWAPTDAWNAYNEAAPPGDDVADIERLKWCLQTGIVHAARLEGGRARSAWESQLLAIRYEALPAAVRRVYSDLMADLVTFARRGVPWQPKVEAIPPEGRSDALRRSLEWRESLGADRTPTGRGDLRRGR